MPLYSDVKLSFIREKDGVYVRVDQLVTLLLHTGMKELAENILIRSIFPKDR